MFHRTKLSTCIVMAYSCSALSGAAQAQDTRKLERVEITGSAIKRVDAEGPAPVEVIRRKDIERSGATTLNELTRYIPTLDIFDQGEQGSNSPSASGTAQLAIRGLDPSNLLVLLNGRRLPVNAIYDTSGAGAAFDINSIPLSAIERIEILKDGGSAIYGADAVAGVVNFITRNDYQGIEARVGYGRSSRKDGRERTAGFTAGFGELETDKYNLLFALDVFKRDPILRKDRELSRSSDFRRFGGIDNRSGFSPFGNVVDPNTGDFVGVPYGTCPPENLDPDNICRYDFNASVLTAYNGADRVSGLVLGSAQLTPDIRAFAEVTYSTSKDNFDSHPVPDFFSVPVRPGQEAFEDPLAPGTLFIAGRFLQGGNRMTDRKADLVNTAVGLDGANFGLDWKVSVGRGQSKVRNNDRNYYNANLWVPATLDGSLDPTVGSNDQAFVETLKVSPSRSAKSTVEYFNAQLGGDLFSLPAGPLRYATGISFTREQLSDTPDALTQAGEVIGSIQQAGVQASRNIKAVFVELSAPILHRLEAQFAVRHDRYPTASKTSPKFALKYSPLPQLAFRGSYTESFRAPVLKQLFGASEQGATTITDPVQCALLGITGVCLVNAFLVDGANRNLKPETAKTYNLGMVFDLPVGINGSIDLWRIKKLDSISAPSTTTAIRQGLVGRDGVQLLIFTNLQNIAVRETAGVDLDLRYRLGGLPFGALSFRNTATYYTKNKTQDSSVEPISEYNGTYALPRYRNNFMVTGDFGQLSLTGNVRTTGGFWDSDLPLDEARDTRRVSSFTEVDLLGQYAATAALTVSLGVKNVFDREPPFSSQNSSDNAYSQLGYAETYSNRGRFFSVSANYRFK